MIDGTNFLNNGVYKNSLAKLAETPLSWNELDGKTVLITGASGLIGSYMTDFLMFLNRRKNIRCQVIALGRNPDKLNKRFSAYCDEDCFESFSQDITQPMSDEIEKKNVDYIFNLASNTHPVQYATDPIGTIMTNIKGTDILLDYACRHNTKRVIYTSSVEIYGENRGDLEEFSENYCGYIDCNTLRAGYPEAKRCGESLCQAYIKQHNLDIVIPRLSRVYGPTILDSDTKALSQFVRNALNNENIVLKSEGKQFYSYTYVADVVSALFYCLFYGKNGEAYNVADKKSSITLKNLAELIADYAGVKVVFDLPNDVEKAGFSTATKAVLDSSKIESLGWKPLYNMVTGMKENLTVLRELKR